jgi:hypothetical protein
MILFAVSVVRVGVYGMRFGQLSLQMDFTTFYTAGESLNAHLSPYENLVTHQPPIWDGVNSYSHSRFLYPPLVAVFFRLFTLVPYAVAKVLWMIVSLFCLGLSLWVAKPILLSAQKLEAVYLMGIFACWYYPLLPFLERGQVDSITLLLLMAGICWMVQGKLERMAGLLFAIAILFKLHTVFILPFLILKKRWHTLLGCGIGIGMLGVLSIMLNGVDMTVGYFVNELPRISQYAGGGDKTTRLSNQTFREVLAGVPKGLTQKDGIVYALSQIEYPENTTLVSSPLGTLLRKIFQALGLEATMTMLSAVFYAMFFALFFGWEAWYQFKPFAWKVTDEAGYWLMILVVILLCAPLTWVMNTIWLIPVSGLMMTYAAEQQRYRGPQKFFRACLIAGMAFGLLLIAIPDRASFPPLPFWSDRFVFYKYTLGELLLFACLLTNLAWKRQEIHSVGVCAAAVENR